MLASLEKGRPLETQTQKGCGLVAGLTFLHPSHLSGETHSPPNSGSLWCLLEYHPLEAPSGHIARPQLGLNSGLRAGKSKFEGLTAEGYIDINRDLGLEYSVDLDSDGTISGEIESEAGIPFLRNHHKNRPAHQKVTFAHQLRILHRNKLETLHSLRISVPVLGGRGAAKIRARQHPTSGSHVVTVELGRKNDTSTGSRLAGLPSNIKQETESEAEDLQLWQGDPLLIPYLKLELEPAALPVANHNINNNNGALQVESTPSFTEEPREHYPPQQVFKTIQWKQNWSRTFRTSASYHSRTQRASFDCRSRLKPSMVVTASAAWDSMQSTWHRVSGKVIWRPKICPPARHLVQLESRYAKESGAVHVMKLRRRPGLKGNGLEGSVSLSIKQASMAPALNFEVYMPR